jgi:ATP-binding cassette subfamily C exporter for protease/lipase
MSSRQATPVSNPIAGLLGVFRGELLAVGVFSLVANLLMLTPTLYMLQVFDRVMTSGNDLTLIAVSLVTLFFFAIMAVAEWARSRVLVRAGVRFDTALNTEVFRASFEASLNKAGRNPGEAFADLTNLRQFLSTNGVFAFFDAPWVPIYIAVAWLMHPWLGIASILFAVMLVLVAWGGHLYTRALHTSVLEAGMRSNGFVQSKLRNAEAIEAMGMLPSLFARWRAVHLTHLDAMASNQDKTQRVQAVTKFLQYSQQSLMIGIAAMLVIRGEISMGAIIASNMLMARALAPVQMLVGSWRGFMAAKLSYQRLGTLLTEHPARAGRALTAPPKGQLTLRGLVARADGREAPILQGLDAEFSAGELLVVLGPSGSGKTTLARCLLGIWPLTEGEVLLDGVPIGEWNRGQLGPYLGYLPQDIELFDGSIGDNIARFGTAVPEQIITAAKAANVHEMILRFPQGYDTPMGLAGSQLSAGQRQRIALARALYGEPTLIVLDEPNANLDDAGEAALMQAVQALRAKGCTVVVISHRGGLVNLADRLLILNQGRIQALGPREALLARQSAVGAAAAARNPPPER